MNNDHSNLIKSVEKIKEILREKMSCLKSEFKVKEIGLFGSLTRGDTHDQSDLDILVSVDLSIDLLKFIELEQYLSEILGVKVDLVMKESLKPHIGEYILKEVVYV
ncbi:MAG: nucleotidyltransferase family protein [Candidatus Hodarchaeales archaeon]|jgi:predicted nucleotidyltransferase